MRSVTRYVPADVVSVVFDTLVSTFVTVTFASGIAAPAWSVTVPLILLTAWAWILAGSRRSRRATPSAGARQPREVELQIRLRNFEELFITRPLNEFNNSVLQT